MHVHPFSPRRFSKKYTLTGHKAAVYALAAGPAAGQFYSAAGDGWIVLWDLQDQPETGRLLATADTQVFALHSLSETATLVAGDLYGHVHFIRPEAPGDTRRLLAHGGKPVFAFCHTPAGLLSIGGDGRLLRWDTRRCQPAESLTLSYSSLRSISWHAGRNELAVGASDGCIYLLDADTLSLRRRLPNAHQPSVFSLVWLPDGQRLVSGGRDALIKVWAVDDDSQHPLHSLQAHWFTVNDLQYCDGNQCFISASRDKTIKWWDAQSFELLKVFDTMRDGCHRNSVNKLLWLPEAATLISASDDRSLMVWSGPDAGSGQMA
jgi:WD40 repeat protein